MKALLAATMAVLALTLTPPALADKDRGYQEMPRDPGNYYDRRNWHVPRHNIRESAPRYYGPWIYRGGPGYYRDHGYRHHGYRGPGYRGYDRPRMHHHYRGDDYLRELGRIHLFNELLHHDQHHYPRR